MQAMQQFDDLDFDKYDEEDMEYFYHITPKKKHSYYTSTKQYYFPYQDALGNELELFTAVKCLYRVTAGTFDPLEDSDWDYLGFTDLVSWDVVSVENNEGDEVDPEKVLTEGQFLEYSEGLDQFIGD